MYDIKYSALLEKTLERAKKLTDRGGPLTVDKFVVAAIDIATEEGSGKEAAEVVNVLSKIFSTDAAGLALIRERLISAVLSGGSDSAGSIQMQKTLFNARLAASEKNSAELDASAVLIAISKDPSSNMRAIISDGEAVSAEEKPAAAAANETANPKAGIAALTKKVKELHAKLTEAVFGQDNAAGVFSAGYFQAELLSLTDKSRTRPRATFLFAGPPGVGKTFLAETAAGLLKLPFMRFDMSEYAGGMAAIDLTGSEYTKSPGALTGFVTKYPKCVLLFDEIEKANSAVIHLFLQVLDAGRLRDGLTGQEVSFANAIIIMTTNAGKQLYDVSETGDFSHVTRKVILHALESDISPMTGAPYFPAAICSRFASGNVVMFNRVQAGGLIKIARNEIIRHARNFEGEIGIRIDIDEAVYPALLFAEGGNADARTVRSRAETFIDSELYELFRLLGAEGSETGVEDLERITVKVSLPDEGESEDSGEIRALFTNKERPEALVFAADDVYEKCAAKCPEVTFDKISQPEQASQVLRTNDIDFALIDLSCGVYSHPEYLNIEDVGSTARSFLRFIKENYPEVPVYILQQPGHEICAEEKVSLIKMGAMGVVTLCESAEEFSKCILDISVNMYRQRSMSKLAKANRLVSFGTSQTVADGGKAAEIILSDFRSATAINADDSKNILSSISKPDVTFDQIIGAEDAKQELKYFIEYLKDPKKFAGSGLSTPKGILLYGPPGTGKTLLAKAMARESNVTFISSQGTDFLSKYYGEGSEKVHELFNIARKYAPSVLFIDEVEAIAKRRNDGSGDTQPGRVLTTLLVEMDGFKTDPKRPVFVIAATNYNVGRGSENSLDGAFVRRFDRHIYIDLPNREEREKYLNLRASQNKAFCPSAEKIANVAERSVGMSLADLASVVSLALRTAVRDGDGAVTDEILDDAFESFNSGEKKTVTPYALKKTARHEAGHAFVCWYSGETPSYMTIDARGNYGGYMQHGAEAEDRTELTRENLFTNIRTALAGRAAETVYYGETDGTTTGASSDLEQATRCARSIICRYGMDDSFGLAVVGEEELRTGELAADVRRAVNKLLSDEMAAAKELISSHTVAIDALVDELMQKSHLSGAEIDAILSKNCPDRPERIKK